MKGCHKQQRLINRYLTNHFGKRVCVAESEITEFGANFLEFQTEKLRVVVGDKEQDVLYSWKDLDKVLAFYKDNIYKEAPQDIEKVEVCLGGDHGKGKFTFIALVIVRYKAAALRQDKIFEFQIGQIDHAKDSVELLRPLLARLEVGIKKLQPNNDAVCTATLVQSEAGLLQDVFFDGRNGNHSVPLELFLIGDLKFLFMVLGRANYCGSWCLYCKLKQAEWTEMHKSLDGIHCGADVWTIDGLMATTIPDRQPETEGANLLQGQKEPPLWDFIPICNVIPPGLHALLGIGNDVFNKFLDWLDSRIEKLSFDEIAARNMALVTAIIVDESEALFEAKKEELAAIVQQRKDVNKALKARGLAPTLKQQLQAQKETIKQQESEARDHKNGCNERLENAKAAKTSAALKEGETRKKRGHSEKCVRTAIESEIFPLWLIKFSAYHGGDMEGPSVRRMMENGKELFAAIGVLLKEKYAANNPDNDMETINEEIDEVCSAFGRLNVLLDGIFSKINTKRGQVTDDLIEDLEEQLLVTMREWERMGFSSTPKFHMMLDHVPQILRLTGGFVDMGEDAIERFHQTRVRDESRLIRLRNESIIKRSQAKFQNTRMMQEVLTIKEEVNSKAKRKFTKSKSVKEERDEAKKLKRTTNRENALSDTKEQNNSEVLVDPRTRLQNEMKAHLLVRDSNNSNS
jgi:hypothetical protein